MNKLLFIIIAIAFAAMMIIQYQASGCPISRKIISAILFLPIVFGATVSHGQDNVNRPGLNLRETFDLYVKTVQNSDLEGLFTTVSSDDKFFFLTAGGKLIDRESYYNFHKGWFEETGWSMPVDDIEVYEFGDFGYVRAAFYYRQMMPDNNTYNLDSYFTLIFSKEDDMWKVVADICTPIEKYITSPDTAIKYDMHQDFLFKTMKQRRTVRKFKDTPVPDEHILKILDMARTAPTSGNQQPWKFLVVRNRAKLDMLKDEALEWYIQAIEEMKIYNKNETETLRVKIKETLKDVLSAPAYIAVLVDSESKYADYNMYDGPLAAGYLMIAARALGYGTGYFTSYFPEEQMKKFFKIPDKYNLICFTPIGVPDDWPEAPAKKDLEEFIVFESFD